MSNNNVKHIKIDHLLTFQPLTNAQQTAYEAWSKGDNLVLDGSAGTGKTFVALYKALEVALNRSTIPDRVVILRSTVPCRNMGFLPGTEEEKLDPYIEPYRAICRELFDHSTAYDVLESVGRIEFHSTSFLRGITFGDAVVICDEIQNMTGEELDTCFTRFGNNTRFILCGDYEQSDLKGKDKQGIIDFLKIMSLINNTTTVSFGIHDIVRGPLVRDYLVCKKMLRENGEIRAEW